MEKGRYDKNASHPNLMTLSNRSSASIINSSIINSSGTEQIDNEVVDVEEKQL